MSKIILELWSDTNNFVLYSAESSLNLAPEDETNQSTIISFLEKKHQLIQLPDHYNGSYEAIIHLYIDEIPNNEVMRLCEFPENSDHNFIPPVLDRLLKVKTGAISIRGCEFTAKNKAHELGYVGEDIKAVLGSYLVSIYPVYLTEEREDALSDQQETLLKERMISIMGEERYKKAQENREKSSFGCLFSFGILVLLMFLILFLPLSFKWAWAGALLGLWWLYFAVIDRFPSPLARDIARVSEAEIMIGKEFFYSYVVIMKRIED